MYNAELYHHGIKGMKWGVRRYQYKDGTLTPAGQKRYSANSKKLSKPERFSRTMNLKIKEITNTARFKVTGKQCVDSFLRKGTTFSRIQTSKEFENFAFYATYKKADSNKYMGLFGKNLKTRAEGDARRAEKQANLTGDESDILKAKELRDKSNNLKVYQLKIQATKKLKIPSDENAGHITALLLKDSEFKKNLKASIVDSKEKMKRPTQQLLFSQAEKALRKDAQRMTSSEKVAVYKALNLSLTNHNQAEVAVQSKFYGELKKKGYNALLDYNDREYSSYHAKKPTIVFDLDSVKLQSIAETNPKVVDRLYKRYNAERIAKESVTNTLGLVGRYGKKTISDCESWVNEKARRYLN